MRVHPACAINAVHVLRLVSCASALSGREHRGPNTMKKALHPSTRNAGTYAYDKISPIFGSNFYKIRFSARIRPKIKSSAYPIEYVKYQLSFYSFSFNMERPIFLELTLKMQTRLPIFCIHCWLYLLTWLKNYQIEKIEFQVDSRLNSFSPSQLSTPNFSLHSTSKIRHFVMRKWKLIRQIKLP